MEESIENQQKETKRGMSRKKAILKIVGIISSFYILSVIASAFVAEENFKMQFTLLIIPTIATLIYGYRAALKENYLTLKTVFILLAILEAIKIGERIISRMI